MSTNPWAWSIGASDAKALIAGDLPHLAAMVRGERPRPTPAETAAASAAALRAKGAVRVSEDNLELALLIGAALEPLHEEWFTRRTGLRVQGQQQRVRHRSYPLHATLDGMVEIGGTWLPWEAKTTSPHMTLPALIAREAPQLQAQMLCLGAPAAVVSVLWRTPKWEAVVVEEDDVLQAEILDRLDLLALHIEQGTEPPTLPPFPVPTPRRRPLAVAPACIPETADNLLT
ncbi:hypothetical protein [Caldovatus aquaticus]|uniref:YqaJ viral recombinase domain-containing protein n=1 Tax=Caldovatus aquaticus TaxID=2865671 RepID=A0ABS7EYK3_9PROT|nr:hypothetical protein [Caldovatus aquaticus]MBW8268309.1 hypothetical protein [Caldovatus aquaticus]